VIVGGPRANEYAWAEMRLEDGRVLSLETSSAGEDGHEGWPIAAGYFSFSSSLGLLRSLTRMRGDFVAGVNHYLGEHSVEMVEARDWLDFGHLQTFFRSRLAVTTARAFNTGRVATEADDRILFDTASGGLYYDNDGAGGSAAVQFATVTSVTGTIDHSSFFII